ncbi:MAG: hypothetical protein IJU40_03745, partial [Desulfovibrionaceae bacterium]|nr:hypothetical protein [Desulfovibrionaceae bacterium]
MLPLKAQSMGIKPVSETKGKVENHDKVVPKELGFRGLETLGLSSLNFDAKDNLGLSNNLEILLNSEAEPKNTGQMGSQFQDLVKSPPQGTNFNPLNLELASKEGLKLPAISLQGIEESLLPLSTMEVQDGGFPPFFGDSLNETTSLLGSWGAHDPGQDLDLIFKPGGSCLLIDHKVSLPCTYAIQEDKLTLNFKNRKPTTLTFKVEGQVLTLSDGSRLIRHKERAEVNPTPNPTPITNPNPTPNPLPASSSSLEGAWVASDGQNMIIFMFMNGVCGLTINGQQFFGYYNLQGQTLNIQFNNGKKLTVNFTIEGEYLKFSDGTTLKRQNMPSPPVNHAPASFSPLEGKWGCQLANGVHLNFVFQGNQYFVLGNNQLSEAGTFNLQGNNLEYTITQGPNQGQRGVNTFTIEGQILILTLPNGASIRLQRES